MIDFLKCDGAEMILKATMNHLVKFYQVINVVQFLGAESCSFQGPELSLLGGGRHRRPDSLAGGEVVQVVEGSVHQHLLRRLGHRSHAQVSTRDLLINDLI